MADELSVKISADDSSLKSGLSSAEREVATSTDNINESLGKMGESAQKSAGSFNSIGYAIKTSLVYGGVYEAISGLKDALSALSVGAVEVASSFEDMQIGMAAIIAANHENVTSEGVAIDSAEKYAWAKNQAADAVNKLRKANLETPATLGQLTIAFQNALGPSMALGLSLDQTVKYTTAMTQAAFALGVPMDQLAQEVRAVFEGDTSRNSRINSILQIKTDAIEAHKAAGDLFPFLMSKLEDFGQAGQDISHSWSGIKSNIEDVFQTIQNELAKDLLKQLEEDGLSLQNSLQNNAKEIGSSLGAAFASVYAAGKEAFEGLRTPISAIFTGIGGLIRSVMDLWSVMSNGSGVNIFLLGLDTVASGIAVVITGIRQFVDYVTIAAMQVKQLAMSADSAEYKASAAAQDKLRAHIEQLDKSNKDVVKSLSETYGRMDAVAPKSFAPKSGGGAGPSLDLGVKPAEATDKEIAAQKRAAKEAEKTAEQIKKAYDEAQTAVLQGYDKQLAQAKRTYDEDLYHFGKTEEGKKAAKAKYDAEVSAIERQRAADSVKAMNDIEAESKKIYNRTTTAEIESVQSAADAQIQIARDNTEMLHSMGKISDMQKLEADKEFEEASYQIALKTAQDKAALLKSNEDAYQQALTHIESMENAHAVKINKINNDIAVSHSKSFSGMMDSISNSIGSSIGNLINFTTTWRNAFNSVLQTMFQTVTQFIGKTVVAWVTGENTMTAATIAANIARVASNAWASITSLAITVGTAIKTIAIYAWEAAAAAYAAISSIPIIGPFLAPVVAAGTLVAVTSMVGNIASAEGGYDIPNGVNPVTQLHQNEMVLPAEHANTIRNMGNNVGGGATNITIHAIDAKGVAQLFKDHGSSLVTALKAQNRNFNV